ncbi:toll-like receptor 13 [Esox lucius]|uniref:TIR domain-containing protein n=1 Tax=Esox lucius TaxID=8010 RepID=A0A3P8Y5V5_ESOLU|nr:toll-like receptor 13 [Esox lucius]
MRVVSSKPVLLLLWIQSVYGWMHSKCNIYDNPENIEDMPDSDCLQGYSKGLTASCQYFTDIEEDLHGLPQNINTLCISMTTDKNGIMSLDFFSQFHDLEYLYINGCFSQILPTGNSQGLPNLHYMELSGQYAGCCDCHIGPHTFRDVVKLSKLIISDFRLSAMAPDVFNGIPHLLTVSIGNSCVKDLSEILCRLMYVKSLTNLVVEAQEIQTLNQSNCPILNTNESMTPVFNNLMRCSLKFGKITHIEEGALDCFKNLELFESYLNKELLLQLPLSGIKQIHLLRNLGSEHIDFKSICNLVFLLSIKRIDFNTNYPISLSMYHVDLCVGLESIVLTRDYTFYPSISQIKWNFISTLKNVAYLSVYDRTENSLDLCSFQKQPITWLNKLVLYLNINIFFSNQFSCLVNLLDLKYKSKLSNIEDFAFLGLRLLEYLDLSNNNITHIHANTFYGLYSLTWLDLRENPLIHNTESFTHLTSLREVFLGKLNSPLREPVIKLNLTLIFGDILSQLTHLYITSSMRPMYLIIGSNIESKQNMSLILKGQTVSFEDCERPFFKSVIHLDVDAEEFLCGSEFMGKYFKSVETFVYRSKLSAKSYDMTTINQLIQLQKLTLYSVDLIQQPSADIIFHNLTKLEVLKLLDCKIYSMEGSLTKDLKSLKRLHLRIKNIYNVLYSFPESLSGLKYLLFNELHLFCSCDNAWLIAWAKRNRQVEVILISIRYIIWDNLTCLSDNGIDTPNFVKYTEANCTTEIDFILFTVTGLGVLFFMLVVFLHNLSGHYLLPLYHITLGWLSEAMRSNTRGRYDYDTFVSYSGKDELWVVEELLPNLEQRGPPFLNLCLHSRDFQLGKDIVENITDSLYRSRHTLCLVSRHYLHSNWCSLELKLATARLQVEQRDILLLVFLEKIPPRWLSAHHRLARLVKTRTYLDWPQDPHQHQAFWDRLWEKLKPPTDV